MIVNNTRDYIGFHYFNFVFYEENIPIFNGNPLKLTYMVVGNSTLKSISAQYYLPNHSDIIQL